MINIIQNISESSKISKDAQIFLNDLLNQSKVNKHLLDD